MTQYPKEEMLLFLNKSVTHLICLWNRQQKKKTSGHSRVTVYISLGTHNSHSTFIASKWLPMIGLSQQIKQDDIARSFACISFSGPLELYHYCREHTMVDMRAPFPLLSTIYESPVAWSHTKQRQILDFLLRKQRFKPCSYLDLKKKKEIWAASWENQRFAYAKTKTQISFAVTMKLISAFVFAIWIVQYLYFLNTKSQASSHLQWLYSLVCVRPGQNPHCWFSHAEAHMYNALHSKRSLRKLNCDLFSYFRLFYIINTYLPFAKSKYQKQTCTYLEFLCSFSAKTFENSFPRHDLARVHSKFRWFSGIDTLSQKVHRTRC